MPKFRKRPVVVEAVRWTGNNLSEMHAFMNSARIPWNPLMGNGGALFIKTLEGEMQADAGDWIICGVKGEFYPCKPDIFEATYDPANEAMADLREAQAELSR